MEKKIELEELQKGFASIKEKVANFKKARKIKADLPSPSTPNNDQDGPDTEDLIDQLCDYLGMCMSNMQNQIYAAADRHYNYVSTHGQGHLPPIQGAGQMNNVLNKLGMADDYACAPKQVNASKYGMAVVAEYKKPAKA